MRNDRTYMLHIRDALSLILEYAKDGKTEFDANGMCRDAVIRQFEVVGEASKSVGTDYKSAHPEVPWRDLARLRDVLIHQYFSVDLDAVWDAVVRRVPTVLASITALLDA